MIYSKISRIFIISHLFSEKIKNEKNYFFQTAGFRHFYPAQILCKLLGTESYDVERYGERKFGKKKHQ